MVTENWKVKEVPWTLTVVTKIVPRHADFEAILIMVRFEVVVHLCPTN